MKNFHRADMGFICAEQGVRLDPRIDRALATGRSQAFQSYEPCSVLAAISEAGRVLRTNPKKRLATGIIDQPRDLQPVKGLEVLFGVLNASVNRVAPEPGIPSFTHGPSRRKIDSCLFAEKSFIALSKALERSLDGGYVDRGGQIIEDDGAPVMLRKAHGVKSALTLTPININGVVYPEGSIVLPRVLGSDGKPLTPSKTRVDVVPIENVKEVFFGRVSAYGLPVDERVDYFQVDPRSASDWERKLIASLTMPAIGELASAHANGGRLH
jgi:hypothetical protein